MPNSERDPRGPLNVCQMLNLVTASPWN